jgi:predicted acetylornithine/succinylornithine family transaminase
LDSSLLQNYRREPISFVHGRGCWLTDSAGREYLDAFSGVAVSALGHAHPRITAALETQGRKLVHVSNHYVIPEQETLARALVDLSFPSRVLFVNSGAEANEAAYKLARLWGNVAHRGEKQRILAFEGGFHGRTLAALSLTSKEGYRRGFEPLVPVDFLPFGDIEAVERAVDESVVAVFAETIQGEGGVVEPQAGFFAALRDACAEHGALLVLDEIQTGLGRTGQMFGYDHEGIVPDIMTLAKGLGGGVPIGAVLVREDVAALLTPGLHGSTFAGNPLACSVALAVVDEIVRSQLVENARARGEQLKAGLERIFPGSEVRGRGLLQGITLTGDLSSLIAAARRQALIVGPADGNTLRIAPPLNITTEEVSELLVRLARAVDSG